MNTAIIALEFPKPPAFIVVAFFALMMLFSDGVPACDWYGPQQNPPGEVRK